MAILLIHAGGTIGMVRSGRGFAPKPGLLEKALQTLRDMGELRAEVDVQSLSPLIDSANASPADWSRIAVAVAAGLDKYEGVVVTHGTDTMAYTAAALCFALEGLRRPVVLTGAMLPLTVAGSDGLRNLADALDAAQLAPAGVWLQFAGRRMHGARVRKSHASNPAAFEAVEDPTPPRLPGKSLVVHPFGAPEVAVLSMAPGVSQKVIHAALGQCDGIVLRCYGSGTVPKSRALSEGLIAARDRGAPVIAVSQCPEGSIALGTYAAGAILVDAGVIDGRDMTVEAAYVKLRHVLAYSDDPAVRHARLGQLLCGEATP